MGRSTKPHFEAKSCSLTPVYNIDTITTREEILVDPLFKLPVAGITCSGLTYTKDKIYWISHVQKIFGNPHTGYCAPRCTKHFALDLNLVTRLLSTDISLWYTLEGYPEHLKNSDKSLDLLYCDETVICFSVESMDRCKWFVVFNRKTNQWTHTQVRKVLFFLTK